MTASLPPMGWWVLAFPGLALFAASLRDEAEAERAVRAAAFGLGQYGPGLVWMREFSFPGYVLVVVAEMAFLVVAGVIVPGRGRRLDLLLGFPAALVTVEAIRSSWPWGGVPLAGIDLGQAGGPLAPVVGTGGRLLLVGLAAAAAAAFADLVSASRARPSREHQAWPTGAVVAAVLIVSVAARWTPDGRAVGSMVVATVQGGGPRGLRLDEADTRGVFEAHEAATGRVRTPVAVVLWPEDVVDIPRLAGSPEADVLAGLARRYDATLVAGIVEDVGRERFANAAVAWGPDGRVVDRYDKVRRVPFGEFFPWRDVIASFADIPARDAVVGSGAGVLHTPAGHLGVLVSYEAFFSGRARAAVDAGARVLLVPTNAASFTSSQIPTHQVATARLRALETGRAVVQAGPTGFSAFIDHRGRVQTRTDLGRRQVLQGSVELRTGRTIYGRTGDWPMLTITGVLLLAAHRAKLKRLYDRFSA